MKKMLILFFLIFCSTAAFSQNGNGSLSFVLESGDGLVFTETDLIGRTTLCFYESLETMDLNENLKNALRTNDQRIRERHPDLQLLAVSDCTRAKRAFRKLWEAGLVKHSEDLGYTIYGDWDGAIVESLDLTADDANFLIIDSDGIVIYQQSGYVTETEIEEILAILTDK